MKAQKHYLPPEIRYFIVVQKKMGKKTKDIINLVERKFQRKIVKNTVSKIYDKYLINGSVEDRPKPGRPPKLSEEEEKQLIGNVVNNRQLIPTIIEKDPILNPENASARTLEKVLNKNGLFDSTDVPQPLFDDDRRSVSILFSNVKLKILIGL